MHDLNAVRATTDDSDDATRTTQRFSHTTTPVVNSPFEVLQTRKGVWRRHLSRTGSTEPSLSEQPSYGSRVEKQTYEVVQATSLARSWSWRATRVSLTPRASPREWHTL